LWPWSADAELHDDPVRRAQPAKDEQKDGNEEDASTDAQQARQQPGEGAGGQQKQKDGKQGGIEHGARYVVQGMRWR
jgi:hypothetical protein